jgi:AcrR family transcriptional regulator
MMDHQKKGRMARRVAKEAEKQAEKAQTPGVSRQARRREETRGKLLDAARALTLERDIDAIIIGDIAERADVGFGSFYNYFASKEAILEATTEREAELLREAIDEVVLAEPDAAVQLAYAVRFVTKYTLEDPMWRWFFAHSSYGFLALRRAMGASLERNLIGGKRSGRFAFDDPLSAMEFIFGGMVAIFASAVTGRLDEERADHAVVLALRAVGVADASALARRKLPTIETRRES